MAYRGNPPAPDAAREHQEHPIRPAAAAKRAAPGVWRRRMVTAAALCVVASSGIVGTLACLEKPPSETSPEPDGSPEPPAAMPMCCSPREWHLHDGCDVRNRGIGVPGKLFYSGGGFAGSSVTVFADGRVQFNGNPRTEVRVTGAAFVRLAALGRIYRPYIADSECAFDGFVERFSGRGEATVSALDREEIRRLAREIVVDAARRHGVLQRTRPDLIGHGRLPGGPTGLEGPPSTRIIEPKYFQ